MMLLHTTVMNSLPLRTARLKLVLQTPAQALAQIEHLPPEEQAEVSPIWLARVKASTGANPWIHGFLLVHQESEAVLGQCGFKGPPDGEGMVEIAYGINPENRGKGYATEAAGALTNYAFAQIGVRLVRAHTLPETNASTRVLTKCGFARIGEVIDPEDGLVWRWEKTPP